MTPTRKPRTRPSRARTPATAPRTWLLLTHQIPPDPAYVRVKVRRQLERIGAVALKNSVYVLPPGDETREDFEWLSREIERAGGETTLCSATFLDADTDGRIVSAFREARARDYRAVEEAARGLLTRMEEDPVRQANTGTDPRIAKLRTSLDAVRAMDFFGADGREGAAKAIAEAERRLRAPRAQAQVRSAGAQAKPPSGRVWVTREGPKVDRMASAWLIRRFIDRKAKFKFVPARGYRPTKDELRFDMFGGEFTHENGGCTFETLLDAFGVADAALRRIAEVVHDIDCKDGKFGRAETAGIASLVDGIVRTVEDDAGRLRRGAELFDGLYEHYRRA